MKSSIDLVVDKDKLKFIIVERKPDGIPDSRREEEVSFKLTDPAPLFPTEEPVDYVKTVMYRVGGLIWIGFNLRVWQEKIAGLEECLDGPFILPSQFHPSTKEEDLTEEREGIFVLSKKLY